jgi:hypothetical protein
MMHAYNDMVNRNEARDVNEGMASVMDVSYRMLEDLAAIEKIVKGEAPADGACDHVLEAVGN